MVPRESPRTPSSGYLTMASLLLLAPLASAATTTGALARVSIFSEVAYSTARACAAGCLVYNGNYPCGVGGYQDLGVALQCGCQSINGCYCNTALASSATSYISSCVSKGCSKVENWSVDLTSMLDLYDSYCATANGQAANAPNAPATLTSEKTSFKTTATNGAGASSNGQATQTSRLDSSSTSSAEAQQPLAAADSGGLSRSDVVALAASLGVGIPSLLIAGLTLYFQIKKKRRNAAGESYPSPERSIAQVVTHHNASGALVYGSTLPSTHQAAHPKVWH
ncbi:hypothetical protein CKAH01_09165 [Colletotrichum kahawae]|uniref:Extracellular membrane protein CFEM domain-containing protein n=1 Tax=Colletotrichum kahawae TaxID=34407 RepID=A0AAD9Y0X0_COLKA|nr:hypothetical protein CKAH01_09165 [Colletotrichum kahawae]